MRPSAGPLLFGLSSPGHDTSGDHAVGSLIGWPALAGIVNR